MTHPWNPGNGNGNGNPPCPPNNPFCNGGGTQPPNPGQPTTVNADIGMYTPLLALFALIIIFKTIKNGNLSTDSRRQKTRLD